MQWLQLLKPTQKGNAAGREELHQGGNPQNRQDAQFGQQGTIGVLADNNANARDRKQDGEPQSPDVEGVSKDPRCIGDVGEQAAIGD